MSVQSEITRITTAKSDIKAAIETKGVSVETTDLLDAYAAKILLIESPNCTVYTGSSAPSSTLGVVGDLYLQITS